MRPRLLMIGVGRGSWEIRGRQLGAALGARVTSAPTREDLRWAEVVVLVKRALFTYAAQVHAVRRPLIWDALDFWDQPAQNGLSEMQARSLSRQIQHRFHPTLSIGATEAQAAALDGVYLPHHSRPGLCAGDVRPTVQVVAYEGTRKYLGSWGPALHRICMARGISFVINPPDLRLADLIVAFRGEAHDGWMCRQWKSGVKLVNAIAAGRPILTQASAAWHEMQPAGSVLETPADLPAAFDQWTAVQARRHAASQAAAQRAAYTLEAVAQTYRRVIDQAWRRAA